MGRPEARFRERPYSESPLTQRASGRVRAQSKFPGTRTRRGAGDTAGAAILGRRSALHNSFIIGCHTVSVASFAGQVVIKSLRSFWTRGRRIERIGYAVGALLLV